MKSLLTYLTEGLKSEYQQWFKKVYQTQQSLIKDNKVQPIQVDVGKLNKPKRTFTFEDFSTDTVVKKIVGDNSLQNKLSAGALKTSDSLKIETRVRKINSFINSIINT